MKRGCAIRRCLILSDLINRNKLASSVAMEEQDMTMSPATETHATTVDEQMLLYDDSPAPLPRKQDTNGPSSFASPSSSSLPNPSLLSTGSVEQLLTKCLEFVIKAFRDPDVSHPIDCTVLPLDIKMWILRYAILKRSVNDRALECLLPGMSGLSALGLRGCEDVTDLGLYAITRSLPRLRSLDLRNCTSVTALGLQTVVRHCTELENLVLSGVGAVRDDTIPTIFRYHNPPHIRSLELRHCFLRDQGLADIASYCPTLLKLDIQGCGLVTAAGIDALAERVPNLTSFTGAWGVGVDDVALGHLASGYACSLQRLDVEMCWRVSNTGVAELARYAKRLEHLSLRGCSRVDDTALTAIAMSPYMRNTLREIILSGCDIGDESLELLVVNCRALTSISVVGCPRISPARAARLSELAEVEINFC